MTALRNANSALTPATSADPLPAVAAEQPWLVYDGQCPFCSAYVRHMRLKKSVGSLWLVDARVGGAPVEECRRRRFDLDKGMVLKLGGRYYYGPESLAVLSLLSSRSDLFNKVCAALFVSGRRSRLLYPLMRLGRKAALRLLGRSDL